MHYVSVQFHTFHIKNEIVYNVLTLKTTKMKTNTASKVKVAKQYDIL